MNTIKRLSLLALTALLSLPLSSCAKSPEKEQANFDAFIEQEFMETMESDYVSTHVFMEHPENFGISMENVEVSLGMRLDEESMQEAKDAVNKTIKKFESFDRDLLTQEQQITYDIYQYEADIAKELNDDKFDYYEQLFESMGGIHYQIPTLLSDWQLRDEQDVKDLITLVKDIKPYIDSVLDYTRTQEEKGLLMIDFDEVLTYCEGILEKGENSAVLSSMNASIDALGFDEEKSASYKAQLKDAFVSSFLSAYQNIIDTLEDLQEHGTNNENGLAAFQHGKEYYELILQQNIGSDKSVDEIKKMMKSAFNTHINTMQFTLLKNPDLMSFVMSFDLPDTKYQDYASIMEDIKVAMKDDFPEVSDISYNITNINEEIASSSGVAAYFNIPALDSSTKKELRVNPKGSDITSIDTYTTVAHEGFPGHMYQYAYMYENIDSNYRKAIANVIAYTEGYAVYAQYKACDYLDIDQNILTIIKENELASYCAIILADIGIHYEGWDFTQFVDEMTDMGFSLDDESADPLYRQLQANPCAFAPYYVGYHEFADLRDKAEDALGKNFVEKDFNEAILASGTAPFTVVERFVDDYINENMPAKDGK